MSKFATRGINRTNIAPMDSFQSMTRVQHQIYAVILGMVARNNRIVSYAQQKCAFSYIYVKKLVHKDVVTTEILHMVLY